MKPDECRGCPLYETGTGFALDTGDPEKATLVVCLEAPGTDEIAYRLDIPTEPFWAAELARRRAAYPALPDRFIRQGAPVVGKAGSLYWKWMMEPVGLRREDVFQMNALRCKPPKVGASNYPTGDVRKEAERCCRQWDRHGAVDTAVVTLHPAALLRDITPLSLVSEDMRKARDYARQGRRVMVLGGGKAAKVFTGSREGTTYWRGDTVLVEGNRVED